MERQKTIKNQVNISGVGIHTGRKVNLTFKPAGPNTGINFVRVDLSPRVQIQAHISNILDVNEIPRRTSIGKGSMEVHTIEHVMAVLSGLGIDNILIEMDNIEVPALDGSGTAFIEILNQAGIEEQDAMRKYFLVKEPLCIEDNDSMIAILPHASFKISYTLDYNHEFLKTQYLSLVINPDSFQKEIASNRTFVLQDEVDALQKLGLGKGANFDNTLVVTDKGVKSNVLRSDDEFVRHKILDLIGDLYLVGAPIKGHVIALKSGHPLNMKLIKRIDEQKKRYGLGGVKAGEVIPGAKELGIDEIMRVLPHRYPFLLVDRIISIEEGKRAVGIKNVTINDYFFKGHFPGKPVMPGVLIIEAMAQVGGVLMLSQAKNAGKLAYFMAANNVKFRKTVVPGDQLVLEVEVVKAKSKTGQVHTEAKVDGRIVAEADLMFALGE
jgi:UDP-3-O-[3-hydroxymyristoyl] N-acetylglucosamine deacetylase/3-hydroxyacyl-[acyl-carrier-protein] dehydratase